MAEGAAHDPDGRRHPLCALHRVGRAATVGRAGNLGGEGVARRQRRLAAGPSGTFTVRQTPTIILRVSTTFDRNVGGKITFTGSAGAYGARGKWRPLAHARICLWWKTTQPGDQWACDHQFRANSRGQINDPEWPLHSARYKAVVHVRDMANAASRIMFVRVKGG